MKMCKYCKTEKDEILFYKEKRNKDGLMGWCKSCHAEYYKKKFYTIDTSVTEKKCNRCKNTKTIDNFNKHVHKKDGYNPECKQCIHERYTTFEYRFKSWRWNAKKRGIKFELDIEDIENLPMVCFYTGKKLTLKSYRNNTLSLDRLDSSVGYTRDNVVFCCEVINYMKRELSVGEFKMWCKDVINYNKN